MFVNESRIRFPSVQIRSLSEFEKWCQEEREILDERYRYEQTLATVEIGASYDGTCGVCARTTTYTSSSISGEKLPDGRSLPNWREQVVCGCDAQLPNRLRALLHMLHTKADMEVWSRIIGLGPAGPLWRYLESTHRHVISVPTLQQNNSTQSTRYLLDARDNYFDIAIAPDYLHLVPVLSEFLQEVARILAPGGVFAFTVPFHPHQAKTTPLLSELPKSARTLPSVVGGEVHNIGWDIIEMLSEAGYRDATAHFYWSEELGYLGAFNTAFIAVR